MAFLAFSNEYDEFETRIIKFIMMMLPFVLLPIGIKLWLIEMDRPLTDEELMKKIRENSEKEIDYTILVSSDSKKSVTSSIVRGTVGGVILGPVGMVSGAISGKNKTKTTFSVVYKNGEREVITVDNDSKEFHEYANHLR